MSIALGCIADDYTGATDLAGLLARSGAAVELHFGIPSQPSDGAIQVIALKSRNLPVDQAVSQAQAAAKYLQAQGAQHLYWKYCSTFDSTAEGNIGPVAQALMQMTGQTQALYCPAFPENGRSVYMGHLFVGDTLLSDSPMQHHPLTPMTDASLVRLLQPQTHGSVGMIAWPHVQTLNPDSQFTADHLVGDAVAFADLEKLAAWGLGRVLMTGGSALAMPIPDLLRQRGELDSAHAPAWPALKTDDALFLSGSCSAATQEQVARAQHHYAHQSLDPLALANEQSNHDDWLRNTSGQRLLFATQTPDAVKAIQDQLGVQRAGELVEQALAGAARSAFDQGTRVFVVAGGETSGAVSQALGIDRVTVGPEIAAGVPWCLAQVEGEAVAIALKSGNFGGPDFFADAINALPSPE